MPSACPQYQSPSIDSNRVGEHGVVFGKPVLAAPSHPLVLHDLEMASKTVCLSLVTNRADIWKRNTRINEKEQSTVGCERK